MRTGACSSSWACRTARISPMRARCRIADQIRAAFPNEVIDDPAAALQRTLVEVRQRQPAARLGARARHRERDREGARRTAAVADQFGDESLIRNALFEQGREVRLVQMPRAERDPAVAAASILARAEFLRRLDQLGREAGVRLPKGASAQVEAVARALVQAARRDLLKAVAKTHFKTTQRAVRVVAEGSGRFNRAIRRRAILRGQRAGWPLAPFRRGERKVRTPQGRVPANGRASRGDGKCHRNIPPASAGKGEMVR